MNLKLVQLIFHHTLTHLKSRFDGTMIRRLGALKRVKRILEQCHLSHDSFESWLGEVIDADRVFYKSTLLIPDKLWFYFESPFCQWYLRKGKAKRIELYEKLESICLSPEKDRLVLENIQLPRANDEEKGAFVDGVVELIVPYLMRQSPELLTALLHPAIESEGPYEPNKNVTLEAGDVVIDAGSNSGFFSAVASAKGCSVYAFEPTPFMIETYLSKTAAWNKNITICPYALWDKEEELSFSVSRINAASATAVIQTGYKEVEQLNVQAILLDEFVRQNNISRIDFIKADIEGAERNMLQGAKYVLKEFAPKLSICTYHRPDDPRVIRKLIQEGNPNYIITEGPKKIYAYCPNKEH